MSALSNNRSRGISPRALLTAALLLLFAIIITRRAWVGDDAYITFRTIDNFVNGYGLTWNTTERVQAYTHPLWMLLLSLFYWFTREIFFTSIFVSIGVSLAAAWVAARHAARTLFGAALVIGVLALSNAFVDYSTSGLENPLTHLLLAVFLAIYLNEAPGGRRLFWLSLVASLAAVNRSDIFLMFLPALLLEWLSTTEKKRALAMLAAGQAPLLLWEAFSILYYGFPFPNTAYAKLNTGIPSGELATQGLFYFLNSLQRDPLTLAVIFAALLLVLAMRDRRGLAVGLGAALYLAYIVRIGGDFMGGRFFTAPLLASVVLVARFDPCEWLPAGSVRLAQGAVLAAAAALGLMAPLPSYSIAQPESMSDGKRINDERAWYFEDASLVGRSRFEPYPTSQGRRDGLAARAEGEKDFYVIPVNNIGVFGYYAGPNVHIIDRYALADPLLARLPPEREANFYIGHFHRVVPRGYLSSIYSHSNAFDDEDLGRFYEKLRLIISGKLFSPQRWAAIWEMNIGQLNPLIHWDTYRYPDLALVTAQDLNQGAPREFGDSGIEVTFVPGQGPARLAVELSGPAEYWVEFRRGDQVVGPLVSLAAYGDPGAEYRLNAPAETASAGYDRVRIYPASVKGPFTLARLEPLP